MMNQGKYKNTKYMKLNDEDGKTFCMYGQFKKKKKSKKNTLMEAINK